MHLGDGPVSSRLGRSEPPPDRAQVFSTRVANRTLRRGGERSSLTSTTHRQIHIRYQDISDEKAKAFAKKSEKAWADVTRLLKRSYDKTIMVDISNKHRAPYAEGSRISIPANRIRGDLLKPRRLRGAGPSIAHEVTHVVAPGEQLPDRFLVEGLAVYVQEKVGGDRSHPNMGRDVHIETARLIKLYGKRIPLKECEAIRTDPKKGGAVSVAYLQEGSFVRFLIEQHGMTKFLAVYDGKSSYPQAFGKSFQDLERDWIRFIEATLEKHANENKTTLIHRCGGDNHLRQKRNFRKRGGHIDR